jgi:hypothetical protein
LEEKNHDHHESAGSADYVAFGRAPSVALQQELGLLSERHARIGPRDFTGVDAYGPHIKPGKNFTVTKQSGWARHAILNP